MKKKSKNQYEVISIENFLPTELHNDEEFYYSFSSIDALKDVKNLDYFAFWQEYIFFTGETDFAGCLSCNKPYLWRSRKKLKKRKNNIFTLTTGGDSTIREQPKLEVIYNNGRISKFYFNYSNFDTNSIVNKIIKLKKKKFIDEFEVKNNKIAIFCSLYIQRDIKELFWEIIKEKFLRKIYRTKIKTIDDATDAQKIKSVKLIKKQKIKFTEKEIKKLTKKEKDSIIEYILMGLNKKYIYEVPNGKYRVSLISHLDIYGEFDSSTFNPLGYLVEKV